jgi:hypothetical protein
MLKRKCNIALTVAVCALLLLTSVNAKQQVERPFRIQGTGMTDLSTGSDQQWGQATHGGLFTNLGQLTGPDTASGLATMANGDQVSWDATYTVTPPLAPPTTEFTMDVTVTFTDGTGRFVGVSGGFRAVYTATVDWTTMTSSYTYIGTGTITY